MLGSRCHWHAAKNTSVHSDCCFFPDVPSKLHENSLSASVDMAAVPDAMPTARFGLIDFDAIDTSGRPQLDDEEELAGDYPGVKLSLGEEAELGQGHLYISSKYAWFLAQLAFLFCWLPHHGESLIVCLLQAHHLAQYYATCQRLFCHLSVHNHARNIPRTGAMYLCSAGDSL